MTRVNFAGPPQAIDRAALDELLLIVADRMRALGEVSLGRGIKGVRLQPAEYGGFAQLSSLLTLRPPLRITALATTPREKPYHG